MATKHYPAIIERGSEGYGAYFPDVPGCVSAGRTIGEAVDGAEEALRGHLELMIENGDAIPTPSDIEVLAQNRDPDVDIATVAFIRAELPGKAVRVQISMDDGLLARIDRVAPNRSRFLADAARTKLALETA